MRSSRRFDLGIRLRRLAIGVASFLPGVNKLLAKGTGGTGSARYCYSVWLRHLAMAGRRRLNTHPEVVAELGPGDSLGIGLAALISGCGKYLALDVVEHAETERNLRVFDELVNLFKSRAAIPGDDEFPCLKPNLSAYEFPSSLLDEDRLGEALEDSRLGRIRASILDTRSPNSSIEYKVPWQAASVIEKASVDMIFSQAVLEHVDDLPSAYGAMRLWLKTTGHMSHQIDFKSHGITDQWNGHWACSNFAWKLLRGRRPFLLNREPHSAHVALLKKEGFRIEHEQRAPLKSNLMRTALAPRFALITDDDLHTSGSFIVARLA